MFWRKRFLDKYSYIKDSLKFYSSKEMIVNACRLLNDTLRKEYVIELGGTNQPNNLNDWERLRRGDCRSMAFFTNNVMHAMGVPVAVEFTPNWANASNSHFWNVAYVDGKFVPFIGTETTPGSMKVELITNVGFQQKRSKVFRRVFKKNPFSIYNIKQVEKLDENIPAIFNQENIIDVSQESIPCANTTVSVPDSLKTKFVYLSVFDRESWQAVAWSEKVNGNASFLFLRTNSIYMPTYYNNEGVLAPFGFPFILSENGSVRILKPNLRSNREIICVKKYPHDDTNLVKKGDIYQLYYWSGSQWIGLKEVNAMDKYIKFNNVPDNSILFLKNVSRGRQERIFTYENEKQRFW